MSQKVIGLVAHPKKAGAAELTTKLVKGFEDRQHILHLERKTGALIGRETEHTTSEIGRLCDMVVVLGGDGTLLQVLHDLGKHVKPILGINLGSLGFLTCVSSKAFDEAVDAVCEGNVTLSSRKLLQVEIEREGTVIARRTGLNDVVINRGSLSRLIRLETRIDGVLLTEYNADGLIVATPTGSTAYSLAAGGPVIMPESGVFVITPISPHVLTNRSVVVGDQSVLEVRPCRAEEVFLTVDGQELDRLLLNDIVRIRKAEQTLPLAMLPGTTFFEVLRQKLKWSGSAI